MTNKKNVDPYDVVINNNNDLKKLKDLNKLLLNEIQKLLKNNAHIENELNNIDFKDELINKFKNIISDKYNAVFYGDELKDFVTINIRTRQYQVPAVADVNKLLNDDSEIDYVLKHEILDQIFYLLEKEQKYYDIIKSHKAELLSLKNNINNSNIETTDEDIDSFFEKQEEYIKYEEEKYKEISDTYQFVHDWVNN